MGQRPSEPDLTTSIDDFFEPDLSGVGDDLDDDEELQAAGKGRLVELRRRAEQRLEEKRLRDELDYLEMDWDDA